MNEWIQYNNNNNNNNSNKEKKSKGRGVRGMWMCVGLCITNNY